MLIRAATVDDCDAIGLITVTASHSAFIGAIAEEDFDFSWTPAVSAAHWRRDFASLIDRGQQFSVGFDNEQMIGWVWSRPWADTQGFDACIHGLYVRPTRHGRGFGRRLVSHAAEALRDAGCTGLEIGCVRENPSCGFYRQLGGIEIGLRPASVDRFQTQEILFGWPDLSTLIVSPGET